MHAHDALFANNCLDEICLLNVLKVAGRPTLSLIIFGSLGTALEKIANRN